MRWLFAPLLALSLLTGTCTTVRANDPVIWFNPHVPQDWLNMWTDTAPWQNAAGKVQVLLMIHWWIDGATDDQILMIANFAKKHHMKLGMEIQAVERFPGVPCGTTEGYSWPNQLTNEAATLKRLNITLDMVTMDEPVGLGHYDTDPGSCQLPIPELAANVGANLAGMIALFPALQIYEIEPIPSTTAFPTWREDLDNFRLGLKKATGKSIVGIHLDMGWDTPAWKQALIDMRQYTRERNLRLGVIEDPSDLARDDVSAVASAIRHFDEMEGIMGILPDDVDFTTWVSHPIYNMPETSPGAQTYEINSYTRTRTVMSAQFVGQGAHGKLTTLDGKPVAGATINGYVPGVDFSKPLTPNLVQDIVPANARSALMGIRLNCECFCAGVNDVLIGQMQYQETQGGTSHFGFQFPPAHSSFNGAIVDGEWVGGTLVTRFIATPAQTIYPNSGTFPVTPNAHYTFTVPASTIGGEGWFGNVFILWFDANGNSIARVNVVPDSGRRLMSTTTTAADGTFALPKLPRVGPGAAPVTVEFAGDATHRASGWSPLQP